jgi:hypothetical protein
MRSLSCLPHFCITLASNALRAQRPGAALLAGTARLEFEAKVMQKWGKQLKERIEQARGRDRVRLTRETMNNITNKFWEEIESDLQRQWDAIVNPSVMPPTAKKPSDTHI